MVWRQFNSADWNLIAQLLVRQWFLFSGLTLGSSLKPGIMHIVFTDVQSIRTTASKAVYTGTGPQIFQDDLPKFFAEIIRLGKLNWVPCISSYYQDFLLKPICRAVDSALICSSLHTWGQLITSKLCSTLVIAGQTSWGTSITSCLKDKMMGSAREGNTRWCIGWAILVLVDGWIEPTDLRTCQSSQKSQYIWNRHCRKTNLVYSLTQSLRCVL